MEIDKEQFFREMLRNFPQLEGQYIEHVEFYEELLDHLFLADVVRWVVSLFGESAQGAPAKDVGIQLIGFVEDSYVHGDCFVKNLIEVSFVENLPYPGEKGFYLTDFLTGNLRRIFMEG